VPVGDAAPREVPTGSLIAVDERDIGLRATWRLEHGFVNLSLWRDDCCVETFHLTPATAARMVTFLVEGLAEVATVLPMAAVTTLPAPAPPRTQRVRRWASSVDDRLRARTSAVLQRAADALKR
jgi:hypothetical protein